MLPSDFRRIENELQQHVQRQASNSNIHSESLNRKGWSAGYLGLLQNIHFFIDMDLSLRNYIL